MDRISRSRGWDKEIPHGVLPMEQPVLSDKRARKRHVNKNMTTRYITLSVGTSNVMTTYVTSMQIFIVINEL